MQVLLRTAPNEERVMPSLAAKIRLVQMEQVAVWLVSLKRNISKMGELGTRQARWHLEYR